MDFSIRRVRQEYGPTGMIYDLGSVYEGLLKLTDVRKAKGKIYSLDVVLMIIVTGEVMWSRQSVCHCGLGEEPSNAIGGTLAIEAT